MYPRAYSKRPSAYPQPEGKFPLCGPLPNVWVPFPKYSRQTY